MVQLSYGPGHPTQPLPTRGRPPQLLGAVALFAVAVLGYVVAGMLSIVALTTVSPEVGGGTLFLYPLIPALFLAIWAGVTGGISLLRHPAGRIAAAVSGGVLSLIALYWTLASLNAAAISSAHRLGSFGIISEYGNAMISVLQVLCYGAAITLLFVGPRVKQFYAGRS